MSEWFMQKTDGHSWRISTDCILSSAQVDAIDRVLSADPQPVCGVPSCTVSHPEGFYGGGGGESVSVSKPAPRIGRTEREECIDALASHYAAERITKEEFDERSGKAFGAQHQSELDALLADLPAARVNLNTNQHPLPPTSDVAVQARRPGLSARVAMSVAAAGLMALMVVVLIAAAATFL
jgi:uncharacterized protein DUF1707